MTVGVTLFWRTDTLFQFVCHIMLREPPNNFYTFLSLSLSLYSRSCVCEFDELAGFRGNGSLNFFCACSKFWKFDKCLKFWWLRCRNVTPSVYTNGLRNYTNKPSIPAIADVYRRTPRAAREMSPTRREQKRARDRYPPDGAKVCKRSAQNRFRSGKRTFEKLFPRRSSFRVRIRRRCPERFGSVDGRLKTLENLRGHAETAENYETGRLIRKSSKRTTTF